MNDRRDRDVMALIESSALSAMMSRALERLDTAWSQSTARRLWQALGRTLADRQGAAVTVATAAVVTLLVQWLSPVSEPGLWMVPAAALLWAAATLVRAAKAQ